MRWIVFSVKGMILSKDGKILLLKRAPQDRYYSEHWEMPGGKVETWNFKNDFIREIKEEAVFLTAWIIWQGSFLRRSPIYKTFFSWPAWHCTFFVVVTCAQQAIRLSDEHTEFGWFELERVSSLVLTPETRYALERYIFK
ncbi:MAG: NUDIX domain-containing protein [Patescibacteria group bacterium]